MPSQVIINDISPYTQSAATSNGQVLFSTNWTANAASDVVVYLTPLGDLPDDLTQKLDPSQYNVAFIGSQNIVEVTLIVGANIGDIITIVRDTPADRLNLYSNTNFTPSMLNQDFGILTLVDQQAQLVDQLVGPRYNYTAVITPVVDTILPLLGPNQIWIMNDAHTEIIAADIADLTTGITEIDTGLGLTGGPITTIGTISFAPMNPNTVWANITNVVAPPTMVPTSTFTLTNPALISIGGLTTVANQMLVTTAPNTYAVIGPANSSTLVTSAIGVPSFSTSLPTTVQSNILQLGAQIQALNMNGHQINNVTNPTNNQDAATKIYVDSQTGAFLPIVGGTMQGQINMGNNKITNMADPTLGQDAVTLSFLNATVANFLPLSGGTMSGAINMSSHKITNLLDPTNPQDAATRAYVDLVAIGLAIQPACFAATTGALTTIYNNGASGIGATLTNSGTLAAFLIDSVNPPTNARVLIKDQASTLQNGIYTVTNVGSGAVPWVLTRATDYDQPGEIQPGDLIIINNGTLFAGTSFIETASVSAVGTDPILFSQFTFSATAVLLKANNLSDVANTVTSFNNISPLTTKGDLITRNTTNNVRLGVGLTDGQILQVNSAAATGLSWSTAAFPSTSGTSGNVLTSNGTNWISSPSSGTGTVSSGLINQLAWYAASGTNVSGLPTLASAGLLTNGSGVPAWVASTGTGAPVLGTNPIISQPRINGIYDPSNNLLVISFSARPAAINTMSITSSETAVPVQILFSGTDTNVDAQFTTRGAGQYIFGNGLGFSAGGYLTLNGVAGSVNSFKMTSGATTISPVLAAFSGIDANVTMTINSQGTGAVNIKGTGTNNNAPAGYVGEFISSVVLAASGVPTTTGTNTNITSISLTAGDWDVWGNVTFTGTGNIPTMAGWISATSATVPDRAFTCQISNTAGTWLSNCGLTVPSLRFNLSTTTTIYLTSVLVISSGTATLFGGIYARRAR